MEIGKQRRRQPLHTGPLKDPEGPNHVVHGPLGATDQSRLREQPVASHQTDGNEREEGGASRWRQA
eukprot:12901030-Prorocentrum_lima.AAC.1